MEKPIFNISEIKLPLAIVGLGIAGDAVFSLLLLAGVPRDRIATFDDKSSSADYNDPEKLLKDFKPKTLVVSPGVPLAKDWLQVFKASGGEITSELSIACRFLKNEKIIGITGSLGKSTVASLLGAGLNSFSKCGFVGGNLGLPLSVYIKQILTGGPRADWLVLELSSYNLENCQSLFCDIGVITFLTANHMERYNSLSDYYETKWSLASLTRGPLILNKNGGDLFEFAKNRHHAAGIIFTDQFDQDVLCFSPEQSQLLGLHNKDNFAVACRVALAASWPASSIEAMKRFGGLPHRVENAGSINGVLLVNDSKATTMKSVITATESLRPSTRGSIHLLLGGKDKALPWEELLVLNKMSPIQFYFFGECGSIAREKSQLQGDVFATLKQAFFSAKSFAVEGDLILLSPGGTSLDEFKNFEERGNYFKSLAQS